MVEASDGMLVVTGETNSYGAGYNDLLLTKFDDSGNHLWTKTLGGTDHDEGWSVVQVSDGGFVVAGFTNSYGAGFWDFLLAKFDGSGNLVWTKTLGGAGFDGGRSVVEVSDSGLVVAGRTNNYGAGDYDLLLAKFDGSGNHLWTRTLGGASYDYGFSVAEVSDGGLVVAGYTSSYGAGSEDLLLVKFDGSGNHLWTKTLGGTDQDIGHPLAELSDGGLVVAGCAYSYGAGGGDLLLARFDADGNTCMGEFVTPTVTSPEPDAATWHPTITSPEPDTATWHPTVTSPTPTTTVVCRVQPRISLITDVGNDQGKQVRVKWNRCSWDDEDSPFTITEYSIWRRIDLYRASRLEAEISPTKGGNPYGRITYPPGEWDFIKTVPARGESTYSTICPTLADSTITDGMYWSVFFVSAMTADPLVYFDSDPDSGYSLDNLPPDPPKGLQAEGADSVVKLIWQPNSEPDLWYYAVYRDTISGFEPASSNHLGNSTDTTYRDEAVGICTTYYYKLTAFDVSGNESEPSNESNIHVGINERELSISTPKAFALSQNYPNPFNPITEIKYILPRDCHVKLTVYSILGQKVATLVDGKQKAGYKTTRWDASSFSSGIYFYRLQAGDFVRTKKMILLREPELVAQNSRMTKPLELCISRFLRSSVMSG